MFFDPSYGLLNGGLRAIGVDTQHNWLFDVNTAIFSVMATFVFVIGFGMVLVMAEIVSIPRDLYEAAEVDGASRLQRERHVTLPGLRHVIGTAALLGILFALKFFDVVYIMTTGGPADRTATLGTYGYGRYLADQWGYANAIGVVTLLVGAVVVVTVRRIFRIGEAE
jgi:raffinose/stachyose/melibiose transport system permease protein